jgi:nucleoid-associated protein YgaU
MVRPGDNLWFIAEQTLAAAWGRSPTDRQVGGYWLRVITANRSRLPVPSDPSLLFPGDVILLPAIAPAPPA